MTVIPVIVINWNGFEDTVECVNSIFNQSYQDFVIYLVDNNSDNNEFDLLQKNYQNNTKVVLIKNESNLGFTIAHNNLFEHLIKGESEFIALINNDAVAEKYWLENMLIKAKQNNSDIVVCKMVNYWNPEIIDSKGLFLLSSGEILPLGHGIKDKSEKGKIKVIAACGGACLYRADMFRDIGIFDPYFSTGYEDAEFGFRAFLSGKIITYSDNSVVRHKLSRSVSKVTNRRKIQKIQEDINYTYLKLMPLGIILINSIFNLPRIIIIFLIHILTLRFRIIDIYMSSTIKTFFTDWGLICKKRKEFKSQIKLSTFQVMNAQRFFLFYDIERFYKFIITGKKNKLESY